MYRTAIRFPSLQADRLLFCEVIQIQYDLSVNIFLYCFNKSFRGYVSLPHKKAPF